MSLEWWGGSEAEAVAVRCRLPLCGHVNLLHSLAYEEVTCEVCGHRDTVLGLPNRDFVPLPDLTWQQASCTKTRRLKRHRQRLRRSEVSSVEDLAATISGKLAPCVALRDEPLQLQAQDQSRPSRMNLNSFLVVRTSTAGCVVRGGTVELPKRTVLLLAGRGAHFDGTAFTGGVVMCAGAQYSGTFRNCAFHETAVYAVHGAAVTLRGCRIAGIFSGLIVSGGAAVATLTACAFYGCSMPLVAEAGASVDASDCVLQSPQRAVIANGEGTHVALRDCAMQVVSLKGYGRSAVITGGGSVRLTGCTVKDFTVAVRVTAHRGMVEMDRVLVEGSVLGAQLHGDACASIRRSRFCITWRSEGDFKPTAVTALGDPERLRSTLMQLEQSEVHQSVEGVRGIVVEGRAAVAAVLCDLRCSSSSVSVGMLGREGRAVLMGCRGTSPTDCLVACGRHARLRVRGGRYDGDNSAVHCEDGAQIAASMCELRSSCLPQNACVIASLTRAHVWLLECRVHGGAQGVIVNGGSLTSVATAIADLDECPGRSTANALQQSDASMPRHGGAGYTCRGGELTVRGGSVSRRVVGMEAGRADGVAVGTAGTVVVMSQVAVSDCAVGAALQGGASVDISRCEFRGLQRDGAGGVVDEGVLFAAGRQKPYFTEECGLVILSERARVEHCSLEGLSIGVAAETAREVAVRHCTFTAPTGRSVCVRARGPLALEDCSFSGAPGTAATKHETHGVNIAEGVTCAIRRCRFDEISAAAIAADTGSTVTVVGCTVAGGSHHGFGMTGNAVFAAQDCSISDAHVAVYAGLSGGSFTGKRVRMHATKAGVYLAPERERATAESPRVVVKLVDSEVSGARVGVQAFPQYAEVVLVRSQVVDCEHGVFIDGPIDARLKRCHISRCMTGVFVGQGHAGLSQRCPVCDASGRPAFDKAVRSQIFNRVEYPRCQHEGAIPVMCMEECEVLQCQEVGVCSQVLGQVRAHAVTVRRCGVGFMDQFIGARGEYQGCKAVGCDVGVRIHRVGEASDWTLCGLTNSADVTPEEVEVLAEDGEEQ